jgi:hypothetical protein
MAKYSVNQIAAMLTEDPNIMNEVDPKTDPENIRKCSDDDEADENDCD